MVFKFLKMYIFQSAEKALCATRAKTLLTLIRHRFMIEKTKNNPIFYTKKNEIIIRVIPSDLLGFFLVKIFFCSKSNT